MTLKGNFGQAGDYRFRLIDVAQEAAAATVGTTMSGSVSATETEFFQFHGAAGQLLYHDNLGSSNPGFDVNARIVTPSGVIIPRARTASDSDGGLPPLLLTETGTFTLVAENTGAMTRDYNLRLVDLTAAPLTTLSSLVQDMLDPRLQADAFRYNLVGGSEVYIDASQVFLDLFDIEWQLFGPARLPFDGNNTFKRGDATFTVPSDGAYYLVVRSSAVGNPQDYGIRLLTVASNSTQVAFGGLLDGTLIQPGERHEFTFNALSGQRIYLDDLAGTGSAVTPRLITPSGAVPNISFGPFSNRPVTLLENGTYRLVFGGSDSLGDYRYQLNSLDAAPLVFLNDALTLTLDPVRQDQVFVLVGAEPGLQIYFYTQTGDKATFSLYDPTDYWSRPAKWENEGDTALCCRSCSLRIRNRHSTANRSY